MAPCPPTQVTVGWISPMPLEMIPALAVLDEEYDLEHGDDGYSYFVGKINQHYIAIATLSRIGIASAADAARRMRQNFTNIELFLLVGIAGGTPTYQAGTKQIVLGDVVVSMPGAGHGGIFRYDGGAWERDGKLVVLEHTNSPGDRILNLVNMLRARNIGSTLTQVLATMRPKISEELVPGYYDPISLSESDLIFPTQYQHVTKGQLCKDCCQLNQGKTRSDRGDVARRDTDSPRVHYGCIGSTSQLQMSAEMRDQLRDDPRQVLAYEMETGGVINTHDTLAIRGICDYADSHKNKKWQEYAAATAAAYAKILLQNLPLSSAARARSENLRKAAPPPSS